jgi:hypothetical protein
MQDTWSRKPAIKERANALPSDIWPLTAMAQRASPHASQQQVTLGYQRKTEHSGPSATFEEVAEPAGFRVFPDCALVRWSEPSPDSEFFRFLMYCLPRGADDTDRS